MSLRTKVPLVMGIVALLMVGVFVSILRGYSFNRFSKLEQHEAIKDCERWHEAMVADMEALGELARDWAVWDDSYAFAQGMQPEFMDSNLVMDTFTGTRLNLIAIVNTDRQVVYCKKVDFESEISISIPEIPEDSWPEHFPLLATQVIQDENEVGILRTSQGPLLFATHPIATSENTGPLMGSLVMGRLLSPAQVALLNKRANVEMAVSMLDEHTSANEIAKAREGAVALDLDHLVSAQHLKNIGVIEVDRDWLKVVSTVEDAEGKPLLLLSAQVSREITAYASETMLVAATATLIAGLILLLSLGFHLDLAIVSRIGKLSAFSKEVAMGSDLSLRAGSSGNDEIAQLASDLNLMLANLEKAQDELVESERRETELRTITRLAGTYAHEINSPLTGIMLGAQMLIEEQTYTDQSREALLEMYQAGAKIRDTVSKMQKVTSPNYKPYGQNSEIIDLKETG